MFFLNRAKLQDWASFYREKASQANLGAGERIYMEDAIDESILFHDNDDFISPENSTEMELRLRYYYDDEYDERQRIAKRTQLWKKWHGSSVIEDCIDFDDEWPPSQ